jgi:ADP-ribosylglycohydrolase
VTTTVADRVVGCFKGIATGDAVGKQTETLSPDAVRRWYPGGVGCFEGDPPVFSRAIRAVHDELASLPERRASDVAVRCFPNRPLTIVPLALALATLLRSAEDAILLAANVGGDSDSVASIAGAILGAMYPTTVNQHWFEIVERVNDHNLEETGRELANLRH